MPKLIIYIDQNIKDAKYSIYTYQNDKLYEFGYRTEI